MTATMTDTDVYDAFLKELLTPELAAKVAAFKFPQPISDRLEVLGGKAREGQLTPEERREYKIMIDQIDTIATMRLRARRLLPKGGPERRPEMAGV